MYKIPEFNVGGVMLSKRQMINIRYYLKEQKVIKRLVENHGVSKEEAAEMVGDVLEIIENGGYDSDTAIGEVLEMYGTQTSDKKEEYEIPEYKAGKNDEISIAVAEMEEVSEYITLQLIVEKVSAKSKKLPQQDIHDIAMDALEILETTPGRTEDDAIDEALDAYMEENSGEGDYSDDGYGRYDDYDEYRGLSDDDDDY